MSGYVLTEAAMEDLGEILVYLSDEAGPEVAYHRRMQLFAKFARLAGFPG